MSAELFVSLRSVPNPAVPPVATGGLVQFILAVVFASILTLCIFISLLGTAGDIICASNSSNKHVLFMWSRTVGVPVRPRGAVLAAAACSCAHTCSHSNASCLSGSMFILEHFL